MSASESLRSAYRVDGSTAAQAAVEHLSRGKRCGIRRRDGSLLAAHRLVERVDLGNAKLKVRFASPASLKAGRSVGSFRLIFFAPRCARRVGRSGQPESVAAALGRQGGSVGRVIPTQFFAAALRAAVGRSGHSDPIFLPPCCARRSVAVGWFRPKIFCRRAALEHWLSRCRGGVKGMSRVVSRVVSRVCRGDSTC